MKKLFLILVVLLGCSSLFAAEKSVVKIGVIAPLTGGAAAFGAGFRDAISLAQSQLGKTRYQYECVFEDDQLNPAKTALALNKLLNIDKVDCVITWGSDTGNVVSPVAEKRQIVHFNMNSDPAVAKGEFNFTHRTPAKTFALKFAQELRRRGITKIAVIDLKHNFALSILNELKKLLPQYGVTLLGENTFTFGTRDFRALIAKTQELKPQLTLVLSFSPELEILTKQIHEANNPFPLSFIECVDYTDQLSLFDGYWYIGSVPYSVKFLDKFTAKFHRKPEEASANGYDMFNLIVNAYENSGLSEKPSTKTIAASLLKVKNYPGAMGKLSIDPEGVVQSNAVVKVILEQQQMVVEAPCAH